MTKVLSKSRFKMGLECPNKLYYTRKKQYANQKKEDPFLLALAQGGFQVEELARMHFPEGILIEGNDWDYKYLWEMTKKQLSNENVIIFEAAFLIDNLFIRADVLVKRGTSIQLIEVKSKSFDPSDQYLFIGKKGRLKSGWKPYLFDVAFQQYVLQKCLPEHSIDAYIMMADKTKTASIDGLNQLFRISRNKQNRTGITKLISTLEEAGDSVLGRVKVSDIVEGILSDNFMYHDNMTFKESVKQLKEHYCEDRYFDWPTNFRACKSCEFKCAEKDVAEELLSGFEECFRKQHKWTKKQFEKPNTMQVWNFRKGAGLFDDGIFFMDELNPDLIGLKEDSGRLSGTERQWLQIEKTTQGDQSIYVDRAGLMHEMNKWKFPLHFIDFETSAVTLPCHKGMRPYEQVAFQFSHHMVFKNGLVEHASEYLNSDAGVFPNFDFIRSLKDVLDRDQGTIFRYAPHENTIVNAIYRQLASSEESDKEALMEFIKSISYSKKDQVEKWCGERDMVDLCKMVKWYYYNPMTNGSNSMKVVLPSILNSSKFLQEKYAKPLSQIGVSSKNFGGNHRWVVIENDMVQSPYKTLPSLFDGWTEEEIENTLSGIEDIADGGAAMTAYARLQFTDMSNEERTALNGALLKYCELDTLAMVMLYEHFVELAK